MAMPGNALVEAAAWLYDNAGWEVTMYAQNCLEFLDIFCLNLPSGLLGLKTCCNTQCGNAAFMTVYSSPSWVPKVLLFSIHY